jgi:hypothetical protein
METPADLSDEDWVSQYGTIHRPIDGLPFKRRPLIDQQPQELSLVRGRLTADEIARAVLRKRTGALPGEGSRQAQVGKLRASGFRVWATPGRWNPAHVSVMPLDLDGAWKQDDMERFEACFESTDWKEGRV